jgi:hypothetical protein
VNTKVALDAKAADGAWFKTNEVAPAEAAVSTNEPEGM